MHDFKIDKRNYLIMLLIIVGVLIYTLVAGPTGVQLTLDEHQMLLSGPEERTLSILFADITSVELLEDCPELGEQRDVTVQGKTICGTCRNDSYGEYQVFLDQSYDTCLLVTTADTTVLFNLESAATTAEFHKALLEHLDKIA